MDSAGSPTAARRSAVHAYRATQIIHRHVAYAAGATALWPTELWPVSAPAVTTLQLRMLSKLAEHYDAQFSPATLAPIVASLSGGLLSYGLGRLPWSVAAKAWLLAVPVIGLPLRFATGPVALGGYTYALGRAFAAHLAAGGATDTFNVSDFRMGMLRSLGPTRA
jgi:uncharacterized protein (DUF697 family)